VIKARVIKMARKQFYLFIGWILVLVSCNQNRVFEKYYGMEIQSWNIEDTVSFEVDRNLKYDKAVLILKYNNDYEYRNLYFRYIISDSLGKELDSRLINVPLFESTSGKPLGKGYGSLFTNYDTLPINNEIGFHKIRLVQYMRVDELKGVEAIGLKLIKS
jgi:gliding motility-associated lipoprotein GldH